MKNGKAFAVILAALVMALVFCVGGFCETAPAEVETATILGSWKLIEMTSEGTVIDAEMLAAFGMDITMTFQEDGKVLGTIGSGDDAEVSEAEYSIADGKLTFDGTTVNYEIVDDILTLFDEDTSMKLQRVAEDAEVVTDAPQEEPQEEPKEDAPVVVDSELVGTWKVIEMTQGGVTMSGEDMELYGMSITMIFAEDGKFTVINGTGDNAESAETTYTVEDGCIVANGYSDPYEITDGVLTIVEGDNTIKLQKQE